VARMSKLHLFDINIPGKITYKESEVFSAGSDPCVFDTEWGKVGLSICYDLRFAELALLMRQRGAKLLLYPGSFNLTTGPLHWELLLRGRALDTQCYVAGVSTARNKEDTTVYQAWGHSTLVDPFGKVLVKLNEDPGIEYCDMNFDYVDEVREQIPISKQKRNDIYELRDLKPRI
jgi:omega-amidase